jgi:hypothetical protein
LADLHGTGAMDFLFPGKGEIGIFRNMSDRAFAPARVIGGLPDIHRGGIAEILDPLGDGVLHLVPEEAFDLRYPAHHRRCIRSVRLTMACVTEPAPRVRVDAPSVDHAAGRRGGRSGAGCPHIAATLARQSLYGDSRAFVGHAKGRAVAWQLCGQPERPNPVRLQHHTGVPNHVAKARDAAPGANPVATHKIALADALGLAAPA